MEAYDLVIELSVPGKRFGPVLLYTVIVFCIYNYFNENTMPTWQVCAEEERGALHGSSKITKETRNQHIFAKNMTQKTHSYITDVTSTKGLTCKITVERTVCLRVRTRAYK